MPLTERQRVVLRSLLYPVQLERHPYEGLKRVIRDVVDQSGTRVTAAEYLEAIRAGLGDENEPLALLLPQMHDELVVRAFFSALGRELERRLE